MKIRDFILHLALKGWYFLLKTAAGNVTRVRRTLGVDGVVSLLPLIDGDEAVEVLRGIGASIGGRVRVSKGLVLHNVEESGAELYIGSDCHFGRQVFLDLAAPVSIGDRVTISMRCMLITHTGPGDSQCQISRRHDPIVVEEDTYIGAGAIILPGVRIGAGAVIGAGAIVTREVAPGSVVVGAPARPIRSTMATSGWHARVSSQGSDDEGGARY